MRPSASTIFTSTWGWTRPHRRDAPVVRIVDRGLKAHRSCFRHAIGDRHLCHVHLLDHPLHDFGRAGRARHDAGAQGREVEARELRMLEFGDEHGGDAIERRAPLRLHGLEHLQRVERRAREDHRRAVGDAREVAEHHAEAVVQRHRNADPIGLRERQGLTDEHAVVENVVMSEGGALGVPGGPARELNVDGLVELQQGRQLVEPLAMAGLAARQQLGERDVARRRAIDLNQCAQTWQALGAQAPRRRAGDLGRERRQHADIVARFERARRDQRRAGDLVERVFELGQAIGRVDVDQDETGLGGGELGDHPLRVVGRPNPDPIAGLQSQRQQTGGAGIDPRLQLRVGPTHVLVGCDQRVAVGPARGDAIEMGADGLADERRRGGAVDIALGESRHLDLSRFGRLARAGAGRPKCTTIRCRGRFRGGEDGLDEPRRGRRAWLVPAARPRR